MDNQGAENRLSVGRYPGGDWETSAGENSSETGAERIGRYRSQTEICVNSAAALVYTDRGKPLPLFSFFP